MKGTKIIALLLIELAALQIGCAHRNSPAATPSGIPANQYVRIDFLKFDDRSGRIWLRLTNWTAWTIRIPVELHSENGNSPVQITKSARNHEDGAEAEVRYYLEEYDPKPYMQITDSTGKKSPPDEPEHPPVPKIHRVDVLTEWWIPVKQSVVFQVPKEHLARNACLYIDLRYEWENLGAEILTGPVHRVFYRGIDLPQDVQAQIK